jgi:hypothetical protein
MLNSLNTRAKAHTHTHAHARVIHAATSPTDRQAEYTHILVCLTKCVMHIDVSKCTPPASVGVKRNIGTGCVIIQRLYRLPCYDVARIHAIAQRLLLRHVFVTAHAYGLRSKNAHTTSCFVVFSFSSTTSAVNPALWNSSEHIFRGGGRMGYGYTASVIELSAEQRARKLQARPTLCATGKKPTKKSGQLRPAALSPYPYLSMPVWTKSTVV